MVSVSDTSIPNVELSPEYVDTNEFELFIWRVKADEYSVKSRAISAEVVKFTSFKVRTPPENEYEPLPRIGLAMFCAISVPS
jgi:hypothetical protein